MATESAQPVFHVEKLYLKDLSFESPNSPNVFQAREEPKVDFNLESKVTQKGEHHYEVVLNITVNVTVDSQAMFLAEVAYGGLFQVQNIPEEHVAMILGVECPGILFPYARQVISHSITEGGFRPLILDPINFAALFQQQLRERQAQEQPALQ